MRRVEIPELGHDAILGDAALPHGGLEYLRHELVAVLRGLKEAQKNEANRMPVKSNDLLTSKTPKDSISMSMYGFLWSSSPQP